MFQNRRWLVIPTNLTESIDFNEVYQTDTNTLRTSIDGNNTFVKYDINIVTASFDTTSTDAETEEETTYTTEAGVYGRPTIYSSSYDEYNHTEILNILSGSDWTSDLDGR